MVMRRAGKMEVDETGMEVDGAGEGRRADGGHDARRRAEDEERDGRGRARKQERKRERKEGDALSQ
jgi:hypothetical protein